MPKDDDRYPIAYTRSCPLSPDLFSSSLKRLRISSPRGRREELMRPSSHRSLSSTSIAADNQTSRLLIQWRDNHTTAMHRSPTAQPIARVLVLQYPYTVIVPRIRESYTHLEPAYPVTMVTANNRDVRVLRQQRSRRGREGETPPALIPRQQMCAPIPTHRRRVVECSATAWL